uniref:Uncharacterized protein n=1 Tax=Triticum urartu TaxID=4572 RepID=A0A8R7V224_TRIUA
MLKLFLAWIWEWGAAEALVVLEVVDIQPRQGGRNLAAQLVVAHVELPQVRYIRHLRWDAAADGVVARIHGLHLLRELHAGEVEAEGVVGQVNALQLLCPAEEHGRVAGESVVGEVDLQEADCSELGRDGAGEVVVGEQKDWEKSGFGEEWRDGACEAVVSEVDGV